MATQTQGNFISATAGADLHANAHYIVKFDGSGNAILATAGSDDIVGVLDSTQQAGPQPVGTSGGLVSIAHVSGSGTGKVIASTSISAGAYLTATTGGKAVTTTSTNDRVFGRARYAANTNDVFEYEKMFFIHP